MMALSMVLFVIGESKLILYVAIALIGYGNSNVFSMIFSQALLALPDKKMKWVDWWLWDFSVVQYFRSL